MDEFDYWQEWFNQQGPFEKLDSAKLGIYNVNGERLVSCIMNNNSQESLNGKFKIGENLVFLKNGILHNDEGPARFSIQLDNHMIIQFVDGGKFHRTDGPASLLKHNDGSTLYTWWLDDISKGFEDFINQTPISDDEKIELVMKYG